MDTMEGWSTWTPASRTRKGSVLIFIVWMIALLSVLVAGLGSRGAFALDLTARLNRQLQASYIARAGVQRVVTILADDPTPDFDGFSDYWVDNQALFANRQFGEGSFTVSYVLPGASSSPIYGLMDEDRKLNLNTMPVEVFQHLLQQVGGMREDEARAAAEAIVDWRDEDQEPHPHGAEDFYYLGFSTAYESKDGPFENTEELLFVRGMTVEVFDRVAPYITVYGSGQVNVNTASPTVLRALGLSVDGVNGIVFYRAGEDNSERTADDRAVSAVNAISAELAQAVLREDAPRLNQLVQANLLTVRSDAFRVSMIAQVPEGAFPVHLECVVDREGQVHAWAEQ